MEPDFLSLFVSIVVVFAMAVGEYPESRTFSTTIELYVGRRSRAKTSKEVHG